MGSPGPDFGCKSTLTGTLVRLLPARREHAAVLHPLLADPETARLTGTVPLTGTAHSPHSPQTAVEVPWTVAELQDIYGRWSVAEDRMVWVIEETATGRIVGEAVLNELDEANLSSGFRLWITGARDRGLGTETVDLVLRHAFAEQGLHRVALEVYAFNPRARHVYEKAGFVHEGTLRDALRLDGTWVDAHVMAILAEEWQARHGGG